ncbi:hypothetical protein B0H15DRAFT_943948 [Mycena belliarum]|uniref:Uncharacterized protein n=1 Tax=Mycena belliarum TaxID=1033014 RepID=A0AAD6XUE0_9AGAR|nr:hypothetical protein B0H15DRAFT_943948 [Mycena belliae]
MRQTAGLASAALALLTRFVATGKAAQIPFRVDNSWDLNTPPHISATGHLVFDTVSSLLQQWPNTRYRNGHSLVPGTVPVGTLLYHGRGDAHLPVGPDWTATDPEHSYIFCRGSTEAGCWHLTLVASRPLQVLYFDGSSAAKMKDGPMDTQDVVGWGQVLPDRFFDEKNRIMDLCNWGKPLGVDGFVRMEMDFEIMLCDFTAGVETVSMANLALQGHGGPMRRNTSDEDGRARFSIGFDVLHSGSWHNRYPGDRRIKLDLTRLISFYDTALVPSLVETRQGLERWDHRLLGITAQDVTAVMDRLAAAYTAPVQAGSGVDWDTLYKVVVDRYADRFEMVHYILNVTTADAVPATAKKAVAHFRVMLKPYILHTAVPPARRRDNDNAWAAPVFTGCASSHTEFIRRSAPLFSRLTASEHLLLRAVEETNREICRTIVRLWTEGVAAGLDDVLPVDDPAEVDTAALVQHWRLDMERLMAWLDWSVWVKCRPECSFEEMCYLPTWPFGGFRGVRLPGRGDRPSPGGDYPPPGEGYPPPGGPPDSPAQKEDYLRPQPRCVRRLEPYNL